MAPDLAEQAAIHEFETQNETKYKVGHEFEVDDDYEMLVRIGGYAFCTKEIDGETHLFIKGIKYMDLSNANIQYIKVVPATKKHIDLATKIHENVDGIGNKFEIEDHIVYAYVAFGEHGYIFESQLEAFAFMNEIYSFKSYALMS